MIYPVGYRSENGQVSTLKSFGVGYGIGDEMQTFAAANEVSPDTEVWVPGSLMSFRDVEAMLECLFLVNQLPGGKGHHDGHMKGRDCDQVLTNPMLTVSMPQQQALDTLRAQPPRTVTTAARPAPGSENLILPTAAVGAVELPQPGVAESPRSGSEAGYAALAKAFPDNVFVVSCDLDPSTKLAKARSFLAADHQFEMSIEEQAATLVADGLALTGAAPQLNVVSTFAAFYEGIAREGFDLWRYQRNLNGVNEGLNVTFHLSHVGACTGRDHFSGWGLDWINVGLTYLPYLHRFYAPADARAAFLAVLDLGAHYGGHIIGIPRDNLPILAKQDSADPLWNLDDPWEEITALRRRDGARRVILAMGAPAFLAAEAADHLTSEGMPTDVYVVNGLPLAAGRLAELISPYVEGVATAEDGLIGTAESGVRGFAGLVAGAAATLGVPCRHVGISDPRTAPSEGHMETWAHFGITAAAIGSAIEGF
jgi:transketolase C-terminal domain/subunit